MPSDGHVNAHEISRDFPVTLAGVREARRWLTAELLRLDIASATIDCFAVSVDELATNLVDHAQPAPACFALTLSADTDTIRVEMCAQARSFAGRGDFRARLNPSEATDILSDRRRGLLIIGHYFPDADYAPATDTDANERYVLARPYAV